MALPKFDELMLPVLKLSRTQIKLKSAVEKLGTILNISDEARELTTAKNGTNVFYGRVGWAITYLGMAGLVEKPVRGEFKITNEGKAILKLNPEFIDVNYLKENTTFERSKNVSKVEVISNDSLTDLTPFERLEAAYETINDSIKQELLSKILQQSPEFFENLVVKLLREMGYGETGGISEAVGKSGDGGIDGIIYEDKLGLDIVYIQAKRYTPENVVGRPALQSFIGSLSGFSAPKGVFITTSYFSSNVDDYLKSVQQRVVTIDGQKLVELMLKYGVGVRLEASYDLYRVDDDYFYE